MILLSQLACTPDATTVTITAANGSSAQVENVYLSGVETTLLSCDSPQEEWVSPTNFEADAPQAVTLPSGEWCGLRLDVEDARGEGGFVVSGTTLARDGVTSVNFVVGMNPGSARYTTPFTLDNAKIDLVIRMDRLLDNDVLLDIGEAEATDGESTATDLVFGPSDDVSKAAGTRLSAALWFGSDADAADTYGERLLPARKASKIALADSFVRTGGGCLEPVVDSGDWGVVEETGLFRDTSGRDTSGRDTSARDTGARDTGGSQSPDDAADTGPTSSGCADSSADDTGKSTSSGGGCGGSGEDSAGAAGVLLWVRRRRRYFR